MNIGAFPASPTLAVYQTQTSLSTRITATNLSRLLSRLDQKLGFSVGREDTPPPPPPSPIERAKIAANLEYARNLLLTLERETESINSPTQRQKAFAKLAQQKQAVRRLNEKLQTSSHDDDDDDKGETGTLDSDDDDDDDDDEDDSSDVMMISGPSGLPVYSLKDSTGSLEKSYLPSTEASGLRNRFPTLQDSRATLFNNRGEEVKEGEELSEKQLDEQRVEQEDLTTDMLALAQALKENSLRFSEELQKEKAVLDLATEGLDKNTLGIEGAGRKMGQLRRNDSVGWLWGILYPIVIAALAFLILMIMLLAPKLRW